MTDRGGSFTPVPRRPVDARAGHDRQNLRDELIRLRRRCDLVAASDPEEFTEGAVQHDVASMVVIRLAAVIERSEAASLAAVLTDDERSAIRATRNIAAYAGCVGMNDVLFWTAVTERVPAIIDRLLEGIIDRLPEGSTPDSDHGTG